MPKIAFYMGYAYKSFRPCTKTQEHVMQVHTDKKAGYAMIDKLVYLHQNKRYPFNRRDAVIPQKIIPPELRQDTYTLACFYFYICIYMRGGIESLQTFNAIIKMWREHPDLFNPIRAQMLAPEYVQTLLKTYIGWDSGAASINWVTNSVRLVKNWNGNPLNLLKNLHSYEQALKRIRNKLTKRDVRQAGPGHEGFRGFQPKMVSMLIYFYDWEGWLEKRFLYPSPADFHNFRLAIANGALMVSLRAGEHLRSSEKLSAPWRKLVMNYLKDRGADPLVVADALWLYSLVLCGNSPVTMVRELKPRSVKIRNKKKEVIGEKLVIGLFEHSQTKEEWDTVRWAAHKRQQLKQTCLACVLAVSCKYAIPSRPYYRKGRLILRPRIRVERDYYNKVLPPPPQEETIIEPEVLVLIPGLEHPVAAE